MFGDSVSYPSSTRKFLQRHKSTGQIIKKNCCTVYDRIKTVYTYAIESQRVRRKNVELCRLYVYLNCNHIVPFSSLFFFSFIRLQLCIFINQSMECKNVLKSNRGANDYIFSCSIVSFTLFSFIYRYAHIYTHKEI